MTAVGRALAVQQSNTNAAALQWRWQPASRRRPEASRILDFNEPRAFRHSQAQWSRLSGCEISYWANGLRHPKTGLRPLPGWTNTTIGLFFERKWSSDI